MTTSRTVARGSSSWPERATQPAGETGVSTVLVLRCSPPQSTASCSFLFPKMGDGRNWCPACDVIEGRSREKNGSKN